jgi:hypothetical protein
VLDDVLDGYVTADAARETYGVVVRGEPPEIDWDATEGLRDAE